jgi:hypothetical protein
MYKNLKHEIGLDYEEKKNWEGVFVSIKRGAQINFQLSYHTITSSTTNAQHCVTNICMHLEIF